MSALRGMAFLATAFGALLAIGPARAQDGGYNIGVESRISPRTEYHIDRPPLRGHYAHQKDADFALYQARGSAPTPLVVMLGGESDNDARFVQRLLDKGLSVAYLRSRRAEEVGFRDSAADVARGVAFLLADPRSRLAPRFVIVAWDFTGGQAALLGSDPALAVTARLPFEALRGVLMIDGRGFDGRIATAAESFYRKRYQRMFGLDPAAQAASTAIGTVALPNAPAFAIWEEDKAYSWPREGKAFAEGLRAAGTEASYARFPEMKGEINADAFGDPANAPSNAMIDFIAARLGS